VRRMCDPTDARRMLNPGPVAIVTTAWRGEANAAPIAWCTALSMAPPMVGIVVHPHRHTADMIRFSDGFAINIPGPKLLKQTAFLGTLSGSAANKLEASGLETFSPLSIDAPLIEGCLAWIECTLNDVIRIGDHQLFVGNVVKVQADDEAYAQQWLLNDRDSSPLTFIGGTRYAVIGEPLDAVVDVDVSGALVIETPEEREQREEEAGQQAEQVKLEGEEGLVQKKRSEEQDHRSVF
jgi:flavin reductase (DIM6/NTAB) family NADH-FMN oxidoreductase RutF